MDELGNTESSYFLIDEPEEQKQERRDDEAMVKQGIRMLEEIIQRFQERITFYDTLDSIEVDIETHPEEHLRAVIAGKQTKTNLMQEKEWLENLRSTFK
jgi:hypothetical protein